MNRSTYCGLLLFVFLLVGSIGCKKNKTDISKPPALKVAKADVVPYEISLIDAENITFKAESYKGSFNGAEVIIGRTENTLVFLLPEVGAGSYNLTANIEGNDYTVAYNVQPSAAIADPAQYIDEKIAALEYSGAELDSMKAKVAGFPGAEDIDQQMEKVKAIYADMNAKIAQATPEEKAVAAKVIAANPDLFAKPQFTHDLTGLGLFKTTSIATDNEQIAADLDRSIRRSCKLIIAGGITTAAILQFAPAHFKLASALTGGVTIGLIKCVNQDLIQTTAYAIEKFTALLVEEMDRHRKSTDADKIMNGVSYDFTVTANYRNLSRESVGSSASVIQSINTSLNTFEEQWNKFLGKFPEWMVGKPYHMKNTSKVLSKKFAVNASHLTIKNISNDKVTATVEKIDNKVNVKFTSTETSEQSFTYDLVYEAEGFPSETITRSGVLVPQNDFCSGFTSPTQLDIFYRALYGYVGNFYVSSFTQGDDYIYHCKSSAGHTGIEVYDNHGTLIKQYPTPVQYINIEINYCKGYLWLIAFDGQLTSDNVLLKIDPANGTVLQTIPFKSYHELGSSQTFMASTGDKLYIGTTQTDNGNSTMFEVNTGTGTFGTGVSFSSKIIFPEVHNGYMYYYVSTASVGGSSVLKKYNFDTKQHTTLTILGTDDHGYILKEFCGKLYMFFNEDPLNTTDDHFEEVLQ